MKKKMPYVLAGILLMISLVCMACGSTQEATALPDDANESIQDEEDEDLQNDPNDGLGGDLNEDTVIAFYIFFERAVAIRKAGKDDPFSPWVRLWEFL